VSDALATPVYEAVKLPPANVDTTDTSDVQIDRTNSFVQFMSGEMGGLYNIWCDHPCAAGDLRYNGNEVRAMLDGVQEKTKLPELRGINWGLIFSIKGRFESLAKAATAAATSTTNGVNGIHSAWPDKTGAAAADKFNELAKPIQDYGTATDTIAKAANGLWQASRQPVYDLAKMNMPNIRTMQDKYHGIDFNTKRTLISYLDRAMQYGRDWSGTNDVDDDGDGTGPISPETLRTQGGLIDINEGHGWEIYADSFIREMDEFGHCYRNAMLSFRELIDNAHKAVGAALEAFAGAMPATATPFDALQVPGGQDGTKQQSGDDSHSGDSHNGDSSGSHPKTGGGDKTQSSGYQPPPIEQPPPDTQAQPQPQPSDGTDPSAVDPSLDPNADPAKDPAKGQQQHPETVTIEDGNRKVTVASPDGQGHVKMTVDDGTGQPKTYDMDFSQPPGGATPGSQFGPNGSQLGPDGQPLHTGQQQLGPDGQPLQNGQQQFGPDGKPIAGDGVQHAVAGPDGKAVIHDGNVTITAEQTPPGSDNVKLTIDDGSGKPTTYVIDYDDPTQPQVSPLEPDPAQPVVGQHAQPDPMADTGGAHTLPAPADTQGFAGGGSAFTETSAGPGQHALADVPGSDQPVLTTTTQSVGLDFGGGDGVADTTWSTQGDLLADGQDQVAPAMGEAGLAAVPDDGNGAHHEQQAGQPAGAMGGGMPMMGGMGGGAGGGEQERGSSQWSTQGDLFDDGPSAGARISGLLDDDVH
jgi:hypothetical protein